MSGDDSRMGKPSTWSADTTAIAPEVVHRHPLSTGVRILLVVYSLMLATSFGGVLWIVISGQHQSERDRQAVVTRVEADLKKAQAEGAKRDAENSERTRKAVCTVIKESFKPSASTAALAKQLHCGVELTPTPTTRPAPHANGASSSSQTFYIYRTASAPAPTPGAPAQTRSSPSPAATHSASPSPSPTRRCLIPRPKPLPPCTARQTS